MSCDNIGSHVTPSFTPEFKADPYHIPGYQGFVPQFKYRSEGKTFSNATKNLFENPCIASSGKLIIADVHREDGGSIVKPGFECQVMEAEAKRCREIRQRCLPGCYDKSPGGFPQPYLNSLQPANVSYGGEKNWVGGGEAPISPGWKQDCRGANFSLRSYEAVPGKNEAYPYYQMKRGISAEELKNRLQLQQQPKQYPLQQQIQKQLQKQYLICPSQTVYDPKTDSRYFMFSQQNRRDCGQISPRPVPEGNCISMTSCKEICPCPQTQLKIRQLYPECGGLMSGYGGHVPGLNDCSIGDNYKKATAKVLKQVVGGKREYPGPWTLKLPDCKKTPRQSSSTFCKQ